MRVTPKEVWTKNDSLLTLRSPDEADAESMLEFLRTLLHESFENLNSPADWFDKTTPEEQTKTIVRLLTAERDFFLTAFLNGKPAGNLVLNTMTAPANRHCGQLALGVAQSHQGQGIGRALMEYCLETAKQIGVWNIRFTVRTHNKTAISLYERMGFARIGLLKQVAKVGESYFDEYEYQQVLRSFPPTDDAPALPRSETH